MRIALVSPYDYSYPGGVTAHISRLREQLVSVGHQVTILAPSSKSVSDEGVVVCGRPVSIPTNGSIARIAISLRLSSKVKTALDNGYDIVHLHEPLIPTLPIVALRFSKSVNVGTFHAQNQRSQAYFYGRRLLKRWFRKLDGKIAVSKPAMEFVSRYFPGYYNIIPNGIDVAHFAADVPPIEEFCDGKLNILFVGRLEKRKGLDYLLRAYAGVKRELPNIRLIVVGPGGRLRRAYDKYIAENDLRDVVFVDYVPYEDLPRYYKSAHVFCAPATGQESFGIVLIEAMASGVPVVASQIDGYASVLTHGQEGLMVPPKDPNSLSLALVHLLADGDLRHEMGERGRETVLQYDWADVSQRIVNYYERILNERPSLSPDLEPPTPEDEIDILSDAPPVGRRRSLRSVLSLWPRRRRVDS